MKMVTVFENVLYRLYIIFINIFKIILLHIRVLFYSLVKGYALLQF